MTWLINNFMTTINFGRQTDFPAKRTKFYKNEPLAVGCLAKFLNFRTSIVKKQNSSADYNFKEILNLQVQILEFELFGDLNCFGIWTLIFQEFEL